MGGNDSRHGKEKNKAVEGVTRVAKFITGSIKVKPRATGPYGRRCTPDLR
jgi:hypothetical protein